TPRVPSQPQRGCVPKPRVARHELPWVIVGEKDQPQPGCGESRFSRSLKTFATAPLGLIAIVGTWNQTTHRPTRALAPVAVIAVVVVVVVIVPPVAAHRLQAAEQAVAFAAGTGREIDRPGNSGTAAVPTCERPK